MHSGPIDAATVEFEVDRRGDTCAVWEQSVGACADFPWPAASSITRSDVASLLSSAESAVLAVGRGAAGVQLLGHALDALPASCRLYLYASRAAENDANLRNRLSQLSGRVLARFGYDAPADWLAVDGGRAALLLVGPSGAVRRWRMTVDRPVARTLFEAFRVLFWFQASREGLADPSGEYGFRTPLPAPFVDPGDDVMLHSGRLVVGGALPEPLLDADIRIVTGSVGPGRAGTLFVAPDAREFGTALGLARGGAKVVWGDTGLPKTSVSRERAVLDLVESPLALQLEWPRADAIDLYHRLVKASQRPEWQFHPQRRLADIGGPVLLEGASGTVTVQEHELVRLPEVVVPLGGSAGTEPRQFPQPPPLARRVTYQWREIPETLPEGAREAELARSWRAVDEWARRQVEVLRQALATSEGMERGFLDRLRNAIGGHDERRRRRGRLKGQLDELGEAPPSRHHEGAAEVVRALEEIGEEIRDLLNQGHADRVQAESDAADEQQKSEWEARCGRARQELAAKRGELGLAESGEAAAAAEVEAAELGLEAASVGARESRGAALARESERISEELATTRQERDAQGASKQQRKGAARRMHELEQQAARVKKSLDALLGWRPARSELPAEYEAVERANGALKEARELVRALGADVDRLERAAAEPYFFRAPQSPAPPAMPQDAKAPIVPQDAMPELGEMFEHKGRRYLAVKTWEQAARAGVVAARLQATLVAYPRVK